jgi:cell division protein FtsW
MTVQASRRVQARVAAPAVWRLPDLGLLAVVGALIIIGLMMIYSVSFGPRLDNNQEPLGLFLRQLGWVGLGLAVLVFMTLMDFHFWQRLVVPLLAVTVAALVIVLFFGGGEENEARRWIFERSIQPGEFAKLATVIYIAAWLSSKGERLRKLTYGLFPFGILVGVVTGLILLEPNLSTAILIAVTALAMFFIAGADLVQFIVSFVIGGVTIAGVISRSPYHLQRILDFLKDPFELTGPGAWPVQQTITALGSGGLFGKGLLAGGSQYGYVPLAHSDAIFAVWGEETGLIGTLFVLGLFLLLGYRGFRIAARAEDDYSRVLAAGITFWLIFQAFINIGVVTYTTPFTGQPLPFISLGGSALVTAMAGVGLLLSISRGTAREPDTARADTVRVNSTPRVRETHAAVNYGGRDRRTRVSDVSRRRESRRGRPHA